MHDVGHNMCELTSWTFDLVRWKPSIVPVVANPDLLQYAPVLLAGRHSCQLKRRIKLLQADLHSIGRAMRADDSHSIERTMRALLTLQFKGGSRPGCANGVCVPSMNALFFLSFNLYTRKKFLDAT